MKIQYLERTHNMTDSTKKNCQSQIIKKLNSHAIPLQVNKNGVLVFPKNTPSDVKEWIKNG
ncbi:hypothetical protein HMPREF0548_0586 [Lactobacillus ultunensis DSM 16047]|uniref:Uncharacterized protein n=1 Tax=Lactobacillus ultunensis DSM 16047 TaxID=525365 RepID=C2ELP0_9LACO|nr:hypothetical protein HMPREF0548_0586 [Lactobacillus ultunensis DSM 16047]